MAADELLKPPIRRGPHIWNGYRFKGLDAVTIARALAEDTRDSHDWREWVEYPGGKPEPYEGACAQCGRPPEDHPFPWCAADPEAVGYLVRAVLAEAAARQDTP